MEITFKGTLSEFQALFHEGTAFIPSDLAALPSDLAALEAVGEINPPLTVVPTIAPEVVPGWASPGESIVPEPTNDGAWAARGMKLHELSAEQREAAWEHFVGFCSLWTENFEEPGVEQPDRLRAMQDLGQGRWPIPVLVMAYETKSLQRLVERALIEKQGVIERNYDSREEYLDYIDRVAVNMVQVSHMGFPDLAGTYDYSTKWKRS